MKVVRVAGAAGHAPGLELEPLSPDVPRAVPRRHRGVPGRRRGGRCRHVTECSEGGNDLCMHGLHGLHGAYGRVIAHGIAYDRYIMLLG